MNEPRLTPTTDLGAGPWRFTVTWGVLARPGFVAERVVAWDHDEALASGAERRPDLPAPRVAFLTPRG